MNENENTEPDDLEKAEAERAERKAKRTPALKAQKAIDTRAISALEEQYGDDAVTAVDVPFHVGHVAKVACRCPSKIELKIYRDSVKTRRDGTPGDAAKAHETIGEQCLIYPDAKAFAELAELVPGLLGQLGVYAVALSTGAEEDEKKG